MERLPVESMIKNRVREFGELRISPGCERSEPETQTDTSVSN